VSWYCSELFDTPSHSLSHHRPQVIQAKRFQGNGRALLLPRRPRALPQESFATPSLSLSGHAGRPAGMPDSWATPAHSRSCLLASASASVVAVLLLCRNRSPLTRPRFRHGRAGGQSATQCRAADWHDVASPGWLFGDISPPCGDFVEVSVVLGPSLGGCRRSSGFIGARDSAACGSRSFFGSARRRPAACSKLP